MLETLQNIISQAPNDKFIHFSLSEKHKELELEVEMPGYCFYYFDECPIDVILLGGNPPEYYWKC